MKDKTSIKLQKTEIGLIPEDWVVVNFSDILSLEYGKALKEVTLTNS